MPKEHQYDEDQAIEVQWADEGQLVCIKTTERVDITYVDQDGNEDGPRTVVRDAMWQATSPDQIDRLIADLRRAKKQAWNM